MAYDLSVGLSDRYIRGGRLGQWALTTCLVSRMSDNSLMPAAIGEDVQYGDQPIMHVWCQLGGVSFNQLGEPIPPPRGDAPCQVRHWQLEGGTEWSQPLWHLEAHRPMYRQGWWLNKALTTYLWGELFKQLVFCMFLKAV